MFEPYCGYGSQGTTAVAHSFDKSVAKTNAKFLAAIKKPEQPLTNSVVLQALPPTSTDSLTASTTQPLTTSTIQF